MKWTKVAISTVFAILAFPIILSSISMTSHTIKTDADNERTLTPIYYDLPIYLDVENNNFLDQQTFFLFMGSSNKYPNVIEETQIIGLDQNDELCIVWFEELEEQQTSKGYSYSPIYNNDSLVGFAEDMDHANEIITIDGNYVFEIDAHHEFMVSQSNDIAWITYDGTWEGPTNDPENNIIEQNIHFIKDGNEHIIHQNELLGFIEEEWVYENNGETQFTIIPNTESLHPNSIDIDDERIVVSNRNFGVVSYTYDSEWNFEIEFVLTNPVAANYTNSFDKNNETPIIFNTETQLYEHNEKYTPSLNEVWGDKTLDFIIDGVTYSISDIESFHNISPEDLFFGQHTVRIINQWLSESNAYPSFDEEKLYISMFDNHSDDAYYDLHNPALGFEDTWNFTSSYVKVYEIDLTEFTAELIFNYETPYEANRRSSAMFFSEYENGEIKNYLSINLSLIPTEGGAGSQSYVWEFDNLTNFEETMELVFFVESNWLNDDYMTYRGYPIWLDLDNVSMGWNFIQYYGVEDHTPIGESDSSDNGLSTGAIVGITIGSVAFVALAALGIYYFFFKNK